MCDLASAMAGLSAFGQLANIQGQNKYAAQMMENANNAAVLDYNALTEQQNQINQAAQLEQTERVRQAMRERSRLQAAMGDANVTGLTPLRELAASYIQQEYDVGVMKTNQENRLSQTENTKRQIEANNYSRILQGQSMITNPFNALLQIGGAGISGYGQGYQMGQAIKKWEG